MLSKTNLPEYLRKGPRLIPHNKFYNCYFIIILINACIILLLYLIFFYCTYLSLLLPSYIFQHCFIFVFIGYVSTNCFWNFSFYWSPFYLMFLYCCFYWQPLHYVLLFILVKFHALKYFYLFLTSSAAHIWKCLSITFFQ